MSVYDKMVMLAVVSALLAFIATFFSTVAMTKSFYQVFTFLTNILAAVVGIPYRVWCPGAPHLLTERSVGARPFGQ